MRQHKLQVIIIRISVNPQISMSVTTPKKPSSSVTMISTDQYLPTVLFVFHYFVIQTWDFDFQF